MEPLIRGPLKDTRYTLENEIRRNTFDYYMSLADQGEMSKEEAIEAYKRAELGDTAISGS